MSLRWQVWSARSHSGRAHGFQEPGLTNVWVTKHPHPLSPEIEGQPGVETRSSRRWVLGKHPIAYTLHTPAQLFSSVFLAPHPAQRKNGCSPDRSESRMFIGPHFIGEGGYRTLMAPTPGSTFSLQLSTMCLGRSRSLGLTVLPTVQGCGKLPEAMGPPQRGPGLVSLRLPEYVVK